MATQRRELLVAAPERWDEACFAVPAVRAMQAAGLAVGVLCHADQREFWAGLAGLEVLVMPPKANAKQLGRWLGADWQAGLAWEPGLAADAMMRAGVTRRLGPPLPSLRKWLTQALDPAANPGDHRVRFYLATVEQMGIPTSEPAFFAPVALDQVVPRQAWLLSPDSDFGASHEWPLANWRELAGRLQDRAQPWVVAGLAGSRGLARALFQQLDGAAPWCDLSSLADSLPALAGYSRVVAADGSLPHLAAHVGATCVTLFGPNDPQWRRPLGRRHTVVHHHVECAPCLLPKCPLDLRCQRELDVERVWAAVSELC